MSAMQSGYTTPVHIVPTGYYASDGNFRRTGSREVVGVPVPNPPARLPKPGHWRTRKSAPLLPRPAMEPRPTGGKIADRPNPGNPTSKRTPSRNRAARAAAARARKRNG